MGTIGNTDFSSVTIDGETVQEITIDGNTVFQNAVAFNDLVAWYPFDTSSVQDSSSNNNDGSIFGSPNHISNSGPLENGAYDFDGTDDFINIPNSPSISLTSEITESAWVLSENHQDRGTVATKNGSYYFQVNSDGGVETYTYYGTNSRRSSSYFDSSNNIPEDVWTHIAWTENTSGLRTIYINGTVDSTSQHEPGIYDSSDPLRIGAQGSSNRQFNGKIRDVRVYNRELSASEIFEIYTNTSNVYKQSNMLIWLPFSNGEAVEKSSNGFNVSVSGASAIANGGPSGRGAFSFDGSRDRIDLGNPDIDLSQSISVCFWANPDNAFTSRRNPIDKAYGGEFAFTFEDDQNSDQFSSYFGSSGRDANPYRSTPFTNAVFPNTWTHYVWTRDNTSQTIELYINGSKSSNKNSSDSWEAPSQSDDSLLIGDGYTNSFKGDITGVRIYDIVLDEEDANIIYNNRR